MYQENEKRFLMTEPAEQPTGTRYAFWLITDETRLFGFVRGLPCVSDLSRSGNTRALVGVADHCDPIVAWRYIRDEIEAELKTVYLDPLWERSLSSS